MFKINNQKEDKILKNIRFPKNLVKRIAIVSKKNKVSFTKFVIEACKYALDNIEK